MGVSAMLPRNDSSEATATAQPAKTSHSNHSKVALVTQRVPPSETRNHSRAELPKAPHNQHHESGSRGTAPKGRWNHTPSGHHCCRHPSRATCRTRHRPAGARTGHAWLDSLWRGAVGQPCRQLPWPPDERSERTARSAARAWHESPEISAWSGHEEQGSRRPARRTCRVAWRPSSRVRPRVDFWIELPTSFVISASFF